MNNQDLRPMFSYSFVPIFLLMMGIGILLYLLRKKKEKKPAPVVVKPTTKNLFEIKNRYTAQINLLEQNFQNQIISKRDAYIELSRLIRNFIFEVTQIKVQNYSLQEIKRVGIPSLSFLVEEYYHPEFAKESSTQINGSIERTRELIEKWK
ncbi:MAG: hypothetical protein IKF71_05740 [Bacilli bacterium]|nr:hypothetical protein [Bacilli bacterium]